MILKNKTNAFQSIEGNKVRPFRTVIVSDDCKFNEIIFEIELQKKAEININKKKIKGE